MSRPLTSAFVQHLLSLLAVMAFAVPVASAQEGPQSLAELLRLNDDTYLFRSAGYTSLFVTTDEGVIVVDPIGGPNAANPAALKAAIETVTSQPVRYVVYSHSNEDHATGGIVFADTAQFVAHRLAAPIIAERNDPTTPVPTILVDDEMALELGGKTVQLRATARNAEDNYLTVHYRDVLMVVDNMRARSLPFQDFGDLTPEQHIAFVERMESYPEWQWFAYGHAAGTVSLGTREDARAYRQYIADLIAAVRAARAAGLADDSPEMVDAVVAELRPGYGSWSGFPNGVAANVRGVVRSLQ